MNKELPKYCPIELPGGAYILHTQAPFYVGRVWKYKGYGDLQAQVHKLNPLSVCYMDGYCIAITIWTILGGKVNMMPDTKTKADLITRGMADYYKETVIDKNPKFYAKFR